MKMRQILLWGDHPSTESLKYVHNCKGFVGFKTELKKIMDIN